MDSAEIELFPGVSETCIAAFVVEAVKQTFSTAQIETNERRKPMR